MGPRDRVADKRRSEVSAVRGRARRPRSAPHRRRWDCADRPEVVAPAACEVVRWPRSTPPLQGGAHTCHLETAGAKVGGRGEKGVQKTNGNASSIPVQIRDLPPQIQVVTGWGKHSRGVRALACEGARGRTPGRAQLALRRSGSQHRLRRGRPRRG